MRIVEVGGMVVFRRKTSPTKLLPIRTDTKDVAAKGARRSISYWKMSMFRKMGRHIISR